MQTAYDILTVMIFAGLVTLFLHRSQEENPKDQLVEYAPAAIGCALVNYLGNNGYQIGAVLGLGGVLAYIWFILKPLAH